MKKVLFFLLFFPFASYSQTDCDTLACIKYADLNSFEILTDSGNSEAANNTNEIVLTCDLLCEIEANRKRYVDFLLDYQGVTIRIFPLEKGTGEELKESSK